MVPSYNFYFMAFILFSRKIITSSGAGIFPPWEVQDNGGKHTTVTASLYVTQFRSVMFDAEMTFDFHQSWTDPRFKNTSRNPNDYNIYKAEDFENIWRPDTYIANEMPNGVFETTPTDNIYAYFNGSLFLTTRHSIIFHCDVKLFALPIKDETCSLYFKSASYLSKNLKLIWKHVNSVLYSKNMETYAVKIHKTESKLCPQDEEAPCLHLLLHVQRTYQVMIVQVYLPSTCIVLITWLGFWIHHTEVSSRTRIATISLTAIVTESVAVLIINPDQVHMAALEAWNSGCLVLITLAFLEFVIVHNYHRRGLKTNTDPKSIPTKKCTSSQPNNIFRTLKAHHLTKKGNRTGRAYRSTEHIYIVQMESCADKTDGNRKNRRITPETVDKLSSLIYVLLFMLFNVYYWSFFLTESDKY